MANLNTISSQPDRIVLGKGGISNIGSFVVLLAFAITTCVGLSTFLGQGGDVNPVVIIVALIIGLVLINSVLGALRSTRVIVDAKQNIATRVDSILFVPVHSVQMPFNLIRGVRFSQRGGRGSSSFPVWQAQLEGADGSTLVLNERGTRQEMQQLAQQVSMLTNRPVFDERDATSTSPSSPSYSSSTPTPTLSNAMSSLYGTLTAMAQSAAESSGSPLSPTISAYSSPRTNQNAAQSSSSNTRQRRRAREAARVNAAAQTSPRPNTFATTTEALDASAQERNVIAQPNMQVNPQGTDILNAPSSATIAPPVLVLPELPGLLTFGPTLNLPSFPPLGTAMETVTTQIPDVQEIELGEAQVVNQPSNDLSELQRAAAQDPQDADAQYRLARRLYANQNYSDALTAYQRALSVNPADAATQNDLGVLYMDQNKLDDAERSFRRAVALAPTSATSRYNLGLLLLRKGKRKEALEQFRVGMQGATRDNVAQFQEALRGVLRSPMLSPT